MSMQWACGPELDLDIRAFAPNACGALRLYKGGSSGTKTPKELRQLYAEQAQSAKMLREIAAENLPGAVDDYTRSVGEITNPGYAEHQADLAASDMAGANARERAATERSLASMGVNPSDPRFAGSMRETEVGNAARAAAGQNLARNDAKKFQLAVSQDAVGTFTGQSNSAASQTGGAASGLANLAAQKTAASQAAAANQQDSIGNAVGGTMAIGSLMGKWRDGGEITPIRRFNQGGIAALRESGEARPIERHMLGGGAGDSHGFFQMQEVTPPPATPARQGNPGMQRVMQVANMARMGKNLADSGKVVATKIEAMKTGANLSSEQAKAASSAYRAAAEKTTNPETAAQYKNLADKIETGQKWFGDKPAEAAASTTAEQTGEQVGQNVAEQTGEQVGQNVAEQTGEQATQQATEQVGEQVVQQTGEQAGEQVAEQTATNAAAGSAGSAANAIPVAGALLNAGTRIANGQDADQAAAGAAGAAVGAKAGAALGSMVGPIGTVVGGVAGGVLGGLGVDMAFAADGGEIQSGAAQSGDDWLQTANSINSLLGRYANGGEATSPRDEFSRAWHNDADNPTQDGRDGGAVYGPGDHTADIVPALLSNGEGILTGEAMALGGKEVMEELNAEGLRLRGMGITPDQIRGMGMQAKIEGGC